MPPAQTASYSEAIIQNLIPSWRENDWASDVLKLPAGSLDISATKLIIAETRKHVQKGQWGRTFNWTLLAIHLSQSSILENEEFIDTFKPSTLPQRHLPSLSILFKKLSTLLQNPQTNSSTLPKLSSITNYIEAILKTQDDQHLLRKILRTYNHSAGSILALVEQQFYGLHARASWCLTPVLQTKREHLTLEESASAASFALDLLNKDTPLSPKLFTPCLDLEDSPERFEGALLLAHRLRELKEMEASVFRLNYRFFQVKPNLYCCVATSDRMGMSIALGYIKNQWIATINNDPSDLSDVPSLNDTFKLWFERFGEGAACITNDRIPQVRIQLAATHVRQLGELLLSKRTLFREEILALHNACYELDTTFPELEKFKITPDLSLLDAFLISRLLRFICLARRERLLELKESNTLAMWNSFLVGMSPEQTIELIRTAGFPPQQAKSYVEIFTWTPQNTDQHVDLQYRPFISIRNTLAIPLAIHLSSNLVRNSLISEGKRIYSEGTNDPISQLLKEALATKTPLTAMGVKYRHQKKQGDVDVLAVFDKTLYIFECKNNILPASTVEQQTTYGRIQKGIKQLDQFLELWADKTFRNLMTRQTGIDLSRIATIKTSIVMSNRLFSGIDIGGHPVRHHRELVNIIEHGITTAWLPDAPPREVSLWLGSQFSHHDLDNYLSNDSRLYNQLWRSFEIQDRPLPFSNIAVIKRDFVLIQDKFLAELGADHPHSQSN
ncbi:hypothetical protein FJV41_38110 [Myxococcus llanfairpwllgwyngyllgogerychwyrndrobwllllantysiliogogogochensis]|uniref:NERD domain-containing protein n=1 Tax=Myxococcus llanfairpwllgwyngyllgogerychwyrndrobwllllantysiliogogogochensis TaxID=2590453 RepID=A0A540WNW2_9BACT|nr:hypothetical protein [Myxococcus llanfairpwllgwyngyllgogerychwyrndrobwllllantysiliogogogochensis]TQF10698.1 hypothetical protein FJV41_38110 [Myxococcus llanfairpwllgwyngyllgogerychwyrndrobwllllantysiliogogogochensis]